MRGIGALALLLAACLEPSTDPAPAMPLQPSGTYLLAGTSLILTRPAQTARVCFEGALISRETPSITDTLEVMVSGDSLYYDTRTRVGQRGSHYRFGDVWTRLSGGPGLEGRWRVRGMHGVRLYGVLTAQDSLFYDYYNTYSDAYWDLIERQVEFRDGEILSGTATQSAALTGFLWNWNRTEPDSTPTPSHSGMYAIDLTILDGNRVRYSGRKTGETVTQSFTRDQVRYTSTEAARKAYTENDTADCAFSLAHPPWFEDFLDGNRR
jgi:hypothetical protein